MHRRTILKPLIDAIGKHKVGATGNMPVLATTKVGKYYRTTIPREVRKLLVIKENDEIEWVFEDNKIIIRKKGGENATE